MVTLDDKIDSLKGDPLLQKNALILGEAPLEHYEYESIADEFLTSETARKTIQRILLAIDEKPDAEKEGIIQIILGVDYHIGDFLSDIKDRPDEEVMQEVITTQHHYDNIRRGMNKLCMFMNGEAPSKFFKDKGDDLAFIKSTLLAETKRIHAVAGFLTSYKTDVENNTALGTDMLSFSEYRQQYIGDDNITPAIESTPEIPKNDGLISANTDDVVKDKGREIKK